MLFSYSVRYYKWLIFCSVQCQFFMFTGSYQVTGLTTKLTYKLVLAEINGNTVITVRPFKNKNLKLKSKKSISQVIL